MRSRKPDQSGGRTVRQSLRALTLALVMVVGMLPFTGTAQAHGTIINPASRAYQCWQSWGNNHMNPAMQQQDPMCWQAFQSNPDTMWNWMSALRDGLGGNFQGRTPDGQLCSNALSRNNSLNQPGAWRTTNVSRNLIVAFSPLQVGLLFIGAVAALILLGMYFAGRRARPAGRLRPQPGGRPPRVAARPYLFRGEAPANCSRLLAGARTPAGSLGW